jgi:hypothetical protein
MISFFFGIIKLIFFVEKVFDYQDAKWNQLMMHRIDYVRKKEISNE